jgi:hypothetical protein
MDNLTAITVIFAIAASLSSWMWLGFSDRHLWVAGVLNLTAGALCLVIGQVWQGVAFLFLGLFWIAHWMVKRNDS